MTPPCGVPATLRLTAPYPVDRTVETLRADVVDLRRDLYQLGQLVETLLRVLATDADARGMDYPAFVQHCCLEALVAMEGPSMIATAEGFTAEAANDRYGQALRRLQEKAAGHPLTAPLPPKPE